MSDTRPDYSTVVAQNEEAAAIAIDDGRYLDAFILIHTLVEALLRVFLQVDDERCSFSKLIDKYAEYLVEQSYTLPGFVDELRQFNHRRNRMVHQLWCRGYSLENQQAKDAAAAAKMLYGLFIEWLETFDPEITDVGFQYY